MAKNMVWPYDLHTPWKLQKESSLAKNESYDPLLFAPNKGHVDHKIAILMFGP